VSVTVHAAAHVIVTVIVFSVLVAVGATTAGVSASEASKGCA
jgi:hypothetical protein